MRTSKFGYIFTILKIGFLLFIVVITLYPFLNMIAVSLSKDIYILRNQIGIIPKGLNFNTYKTVLKDTRILKSYYNTIVYVVLGTSIALSVTAAAAFALSSPKLPFRKGFTLMIVFTMFFGGGMIPTYLVVKSLKMIDTIWAVIIPGSISTWNIILMRSFFSAIPKELGESARMDGLKDIGVFWYIILPLSKAALSTIGLFYAVGYWNSFMGPFIYLTKPDKYPLQVILRQIVIANEYIGDVTGISGDTLIIPEALKFATIVVSTLPIICVYPFLQKHFVKGIMLGAVKG